MIVCLFVWIALPTTQLFKLEIAHVSLVEGDARSEDDPFSPRHIQQELALCQRYYEKGYSQLNIWAGSTGWAYSTRIGFAVHKRTTPTMSHTVDGTTNVASQSPDGVNTGYFVHKGSASAIGNMAGSFFWVADAEL